jgi:hypothetical protein
MSFDSTHGDVLDELHAIRRLHKEEKRTFWLILPIIFLAHTVVLAIILWLTIWFFDSTTPALYIALGAYISTALGWHLEKILERVNQISLHAISVHDEIMTIKMLIEEEQAKGARPDLKFIKK